MDSRNKIVTDVLNIKFIKKLPFPKECGKIQARQCESMSKWRFRKKMLNKDFHFLEELQNYQNFQFEFFKFFFYWQLNSTSNELYTTLG